MIESFLRVLINPTIIEAIFKLLAFMTSCSVLMGYGISLGKSGQLWSAAGVIFLAFMLLTLSFIYGGLKLLIPISHGVTPGVDHIQANEYLAHMTEDRRKEVLKIIFWSKPAFVLMVGILVYFFVFTLIFDVMLAKIVNT